jgi:NADH-quinone oxidoreductase subunit G
MVVRTDTERVKAARAGVMELLLVNHPLDCPICDQAGECKLQDYAYEYGVLESRTREPRRALKKNVDLGPHVVFDQERCILCRRCRRFCREIPKTGELVVLNRGDQSVIETLPGRPLDNPYSMNVVDICPVGALTSKDFRFKIRVWFLEDVPGICTGCAGGCNVHLGVANNKVYRYVPRRNDAVNETWICDAGRMSYREIGAADRSRHSMVRGSLGVLEEVTFEAAVEEAAARLRRLIESKGVGVIAGIASPHATNEDLFSFRRLFGALGAETVGVAVVRGEAEDLLIREEKAANAAGARAIGFGEARAVVDRIRSGGIEAVICMGHDALHPSYLGSAEALADLDTVVVLDTHQSELHQVAHVVFPVRHAAEKLGTLTNAAGRVQRVRPAVEPTWEAYPDGFVIAHLGVALGLEGFEARFDAREVCKALASANSTFAGIDLDALGDGGRSLASVGGARKGSSG